MLPPVAMVPARSMSFAISEKAEGGYPRIDDGSPAAMPDLALRHGEPRDRVHQQIHVLALVPEILGDRMGQVGAPDPHHGRLVGGGHDHDGFLQALGPELLFNEVLYLPAALSDQRHDVHVRVGVARYHGDER